MICFTNQLPDFFQSRQPVVFLSSDPIINRPNWTTKLIVITGDNVNTSVVFTKDKPKENYQIIINTDGNGTWVSGGGTYEEGSTCMVSARSGNFDGWYDRTGGGNTLVSTSRNYRFTVTGNRMLFAKYNP